MILLINLQHPFVLSFRRHIFSFTVAGARMLYKNLPKTVGLRRLSLHKSQTLHSTEVTYLLLVECTHFMDHIGEAANLLPILRDGDASHFLRWDKYFHILIIQSGSIAQSQGLLEKCCGSSPDWWAILQLLCSQARRKLLEEHTQKLSSKPCD